MNERSLLRETRERGRHARARGVLFDTPEDEFRALMAGAGFRLERLHATPGPLFVLEANPQ